MASFSAEMRVGGRSYPLTNCTFGVQQATHQRGRVSTKVRYELVYLALDVPDDDNLLAWTADVHKQLAVEIVFRNAAGGNALETLSLKAAYCVAYREEFVQGDAQRGAYQCLLMLSAPSGFTLQAGGSASAFMAPLAREHGSPVQVTPALQTTPALSRFGELPQRGYEDPTNPIDPRRMELWKGYLERRGIKFEIGTPTVELKLFDTNSVGLYMLHTRTIYLLHPPNTATFFEEAFHALQHLRQHPERKVLPTGQNVDAWEYDAKQTLLKHSEKLGISYEEYIQTEKQLNQVIHNEYDDRGYDDFD